MYKIVRSNEGTLRSIAQGKSANNLITKDTSADLSLATTNAKNYYEKETTEYNRIYYVLEGKMELKFGDEGGFLSPGDACYLNAGTEYEMSGTFKAVVVNQPAFGSSLH